MRSTIRILALLPLAVGAAACATIIHGTSEDVNINSTPTNVAVSVDNHPIGQTPVVYKMTRKDDHTVTLTLDGYQATTVPVTRSVSGWFFGNILIGGLIGIAVDAISGGMYTLKPEQLQAALAKDGTAARVEKDGLYVFVVMKPDPSWTQVGMLQPAR
jgi:hypothetical protein